MDVRLVVKKGASGKRTMRLKSEETIVGRRRDCDLRISSSEVSRRHCLFEFTGGRWHVTDLGSLNGVYVNGQRVTHAILAEGDVLRIGGVNLRAEFSADNGLRLAS